MSAETTFDVTLTLRGPILTQGAAAGTPGIDAPMAVSADGRYCLPWSLIRGRMRQSAEELRVVDTALCPLDPEDWFGTEPDKATVASKNGNVTPNRGRLMAEDFTSSVRASSAIRHRIAIEAERGAVKQGALMVMEAPFATGTDVLFTGKLRCVLPAGLAAHDAEKHLAAVFRWITAFGGQRTVGFGRVTSAEVHSVSAPTVQPRTPATEHTRLELNLEPASPFCFAWHKTSADNLFLSRRVIPGAAIKGAVAERWRRLANAAPRTPVSTFIDPDRALLAQHFDALVFRDALPTEKTKPRAAVPPASLVRIKDAPASFYDVALCDAPRLVGGKAPAFSVDWKDKDYEAVNSAFRLAFPGTITRVRNAMDRDTLRTEDEKLFSQELIKPDACDWLAGVDAERVPAEYRREVLRQLASLLGNGLPGLGKTKTFASITASSAAPLPLPGALAAQTYIVTLQTAALLADPLKITGPATAGQMKDAYSADWTQLSGGSLKLERHFALQSLAGGYYLHETFRKGKPYYPWLLTEPGAVFVLTVTPGRDADARAFLESALRGGLDLPAWATERYGAGWKDCPFIPENGYGEIAVNMDCHTSHQPPSPTASDVIPALT